MKRILYDNLVHHPLGGGSYVFKKKYVDYIASQITKPNIRISIGAQPNGSPHFGTLTTFSLAFSLAQKLQEKGKNVSIVLELVDTAISEDHSFNGVRYQKSLSYTGEINEYIGHYQELLEKLKSYSRVNFKIRKQSEFNSHQKMPEIISKLLDKRKQIGALLAPESKQIALRIACPECGLADKHGLKNSYEDKTISFFCPAHGQSSINFNEEPHKLEYNTPLRNLVKGIVYSEDNRDENIPYAWIRVTGSDYAGTYQEQMLYKGAAILGVNASDLPFIVYCPLITDWSGAKLSKSLYVNGGAYKYLGEQGLDYLIDYSSFQEKFGRDGLEKLYQEVSLWLDESYRLFRNYSIYYFANLFNKTINYSSQGEVYWRRIAREKNEAQTVVDKMKSEIIVANKLDEQFQDNLEDILALQKKLCQLQIRDSGEVDQEFVEFVEDRLEKVIQKLSGCVNKKRIESLCLEQIALTGLEVELSKLPEQKMAASIVQQDPVISGKRVFN